MRVAIIHWSDELVGGQEVYVAAAAKGLASSGHELLFWHETSSQGDQRRIGLPANCDRVSAAGDVGTALAALAEWRPDVLFVNSLLDAEIGKRLLKVAPAVFFAHTYYGTCISGTKTHSWPGPPVACTRIFGRACLALYFPRRCGGRNPLTLLRHYRDQSRRLDLLSQYKCILTASEHMRREYLHHGLGEAVVRTVHYPVPAPSQRSETVRVPDYQPNHLLFLGRMDGTKGGEMLLAALPLIRSRLGRPVRLTMAGDGPERASWASAAADVTRDHPDVRIEFPGWLDSDARLDAVDKADLLVVPSLWPEPFGLVGPETGHRGLPAVAFAIGGIPEWLTDGVNGKLAPSDPPTPDGLADAAAHCLSDPLRYAQLREGARKLALRFAPETHAQALEQVLREVADAEPARSPSLGAVVPGQEA